MDEQREGWYSPPWRIVVHVRLVRTSREDGGIVHERLRLRDDTVENHVVAHGNLAAAGLQRIFYYPSLSFDQHFEWPILIGCVGILVLPQLLMLLIIHTELYLDSSSAEENLDALVISTSGILAIAKVMCFRIWPDGLISNFTSAVKDYSELNNVESRKIMRRHAYMGRVAFASVIFCSYFGSTLFTIVSILVEDKEEETNVTAENVPDYPIPSGRALAVINVPEDYYLLIFVVEYLMLIVTSTGNLGSDSLFFGITFHVCGQVEILRTEFSKLKNEKETTQECFNLLTKRHIYLLDLVEMLNETISSILIIQLLSSCILICTSGFQLVLALNVGNVIMIVKAILVCSALMVQLFGYSYVGDYLKRQMEGIGNAAYSGKWFDMPKHRAKDIIYVIMRSQSPVHLTAGKFFIINMETYMSIVKTSMSYLSVLRVMISA